MQSMHMSHYRYQNILFLTSISVIKVFVIVGARPQFIKHAAIQIAAKNYSADVELITCHTGQHYDDNMSKVFFDDLNIPHPEILLKGDFGHSTELLSSVKKEIKQHIRDSKSDAVMVYGDTYSTLAGAESASELSLPLIHVEAGLRSYNLEMPEERIRVATDQMSQLLLCPSTVAVDNLKKENIEEGVVLCGDLMKDVVRIVNKRIELKSDDPYIYATLHRPYNVDEKERLVYVLESLNDLQLPVILPLHPRVKKNIQTFNIKLDSYQNISFISPQSYLSNLSYLKNSEALMTDSGGMQKEAYWLHKKCITIRTETEWTETLVGGWNQLVFNELASIKRLLNVLPDSNAYDPSLYGDGQAGKEILSLIIDKFRPQIAY